MGEKTRHKKCIRLMADTLFFFVFQMVIYFPSKTDLLFEKSRFPVTS